MAQLGTELVEIVMSIKVERVIFRVGEGSFAVTLPKEWVRYNCLKPGDIVEIIANDDVVIKVKGKSEDRELVLV